MSTTNEKRKGRESRLCLARTHSPKRQEAEEKKTSSRVGFSPPPIKKEQKKRSKYDILMWSYVTCTYIRNEIIIRILFLVFVCNEQWSFFCLSLFYTYRWSTICSSSKKYLWSIRSMWIQKIWCISLDSSEKKKERWRHLFFVQIQIKYRKERKIKKEIFFYKLIDDHRHLFVFLKEKMDMFR